LGAAYAEAGRFDEALATVRQALTQVSPERHAELIKELRQGLTLYEQHKPFREPTGANQFAPDG
jgi:hypothetical protein